MIKCLHFHSLDTPPASVALDHISSLHAVSLLYQKADRNKIIFVLYCMYRQHEICCFGHVKRIQMLTNHKIYKDNRLR